MDTTITGRDGRPRCRWCGAAPEFLHDHDAEWGFPAGDGRRFVKPTAVCAFMRAMGAVNDHVEDGVVRATVERARRAFGRPGG